MEEVKKKSESSEWGWQSDHNDFPQFKSGSIYLQSTHPARGITHEYIPSLMELSLIIEQQMFEWDLWIPADIKEWTWFPSEEYDEKYGALTFAQRRSLLLEIALFAYDFNDALISNEERLMHDSSQVISEIISELPRSICDMISEFNSQDLNYAANDIRDGYRKEFTDEQRRLLSKRTKAMLIANQKQSLDMGDDEECAAEIRDISSKPGMFWDYLKCQGSTTPKVSNDFHCLFHSAGTKESNCCVCPTPLIRDFMINGTRFICLNVFVVRKSNEMWMGVYSQSAFAKELLSSSSLSTDDGHLRTPENAVLFYGGRSRRIRGQSYRILSVDSPVYQDGCWGNIQHLSEQSVFRRIHLPFYQSGDWVSFKVDTLVHSMDVFLNNERIISNVDCSDLPMPWVFVTVLNADEDMVSLEQVFDLSAKDAEGFVDGMNYRNTTEPT